LLKDEWPSIREAAARSLKKIKEQKPGSDADLPGGAVRIELQPKDDAPRGLFPIVRIPAVAHPDSPVDLYRNAASGKIGKGWAELVGRFETVFSPDDEFQVGEFVRRGNRITADIRCISAPQQQAPARYSSCYIRAPLTADLPPGRYYAMIQLTEYLREGDELVPAQKNKIRKHGYLTCFVDVPAKDAKALQTDWLLPGSKLSLEEAMKPFSFVVVCETVSDAFIVFEGPNTYVTQQDVEVLNLLAGAAGRPKELALKYYWTDTASRHETFLSKGQKAIWVVSSHASSGKPYYVGDKALPDTPDNRAAVRAQYEVSRTRNFMIHGFKVLHAMPDRYWPVSANVGVVNARFDEVKKIEKDISDLIRKRLNGLAKDDIVTPQRRSPIEKELLDAINAKFPGGPVRHVYLQLDIK
jgi:hypothetical protein